MPGGLIGRRAPSPAVPFDGCGRIARVSAGDSALAVVRPEVHDATAASGPVGLWVVGPGARRGDGPRFPPPHPSPANSPDGVPAAVPCANATGERRERAGAGGRARAIDQLRVERPSGARDDWTVYDA